MKTFNKRFDTALLMFALLVLVCGGPRARAQTVTWERKAFGQQQTTPCSGPFTFPNNNAWTQDQLVLVDTGCEPDQEYLAEPSNWNTVTYPNGASVDVILGNAGGAPTSLDRAAPITLHSLTVLNVGGLTAEFGSSLTASIFDFQGDGSLPAAGGGGPNPLFSLAGGGVLKKSGGSGTYLFDTGIVLRVLNGGTIASQAGTLQLPAAATYAGGVTFNAASGAVIDLAPASATVDISGLFTGSNVGGRVRLKDGSLRTFFGSGGATFNFSGDTFQWQGGAIDSSAADPFINAGTMNITGAPFLHGQGFINQGVLAQSGAGAFNLPFGRLLTNAPSGTFDIRNDNGLTGIGGGGANPVFNNSGTLRKSAGTGASVIDRSITFNNLHGTIRVDTGKLVFANGLTTRNGTGDGGALVVAPGATLQLTDGTNDAVYHGTYTGSGGGTILMSGGNLAPDSFNIGLTFNFPAPMFQWTGGAIGGYQSAVPVTNAGVMTLAGSAEKQTYGDFINNGTIIQKDSGRLGVSVPNSGGVFTNNPPAIYDLQSDAGLYSGTFNNSGLFRKSGGTGVSVVDLPFHNAGTAEVKSGSIQFAHFNQTAGTTNLNGGNLTFTNEAVFDGGSLVGSGTITGAIRNNNGTVAPGHSAGRITVMGNYTQATNGALRVEIGGAAGGTQFDQLIVRDTATLSGTLNVSSLNGFQANPGQTFQILSAGLISGAFTNVIGATVSYTATGVFVHPTGTAKGDFNSDGFTDYLLFNSSSRRTAIWYLQGNAFLNGAYGPTLPAGWSVVCSADMNRDGKPDYLLFNAGTRQTAVWYLNNITYSGSAYGPTLPVGWSLIAAVDFNNDVKPDYVLFNSSTRQTAVWFLNGTAFASAASGPTLPAGWVLSDAVDFNNNGKPDFLLANSGTRQTALWYLNGAAYASSAVGPTLPSGWKLQGAANFNGDGKPDYVLFEASTRRTAIWYLNGATLAGGASGPTLGAGYNLAAP